jgi:signal transduction histidine kinase
MRRVPTTAVILISAIIVDATFSNLSDIMAKQLASQWGIALFIIITATIFGSGQYLLSGFANQTTRDLRIKKPFFNLIYKIVTNIQYALMAILFFIIILIVFSSHYYVVLIVAATATSYILSTVIMCLSSYRFFSWYKLNKKNIMFLLYCLATALAAGGMIAGNISQNGLLLLEKPIKVTAQSNTQFPTFASSNSTMAILFSAMFIQLIVAYVFAWGASAILLRHHFQRVGRVRYWSLMSVPLVSFIIGALPVLVGAPTNNAFALFSQNLLPFRILSTVATIAGGIVFGVAFLATAKSLHQIQGAHQSDRYLVDYMRMSSYGVMVLTVSLAANIIQAPYPAFGVPAISFVALGSYLFSFGLYSASVSISEDTNLRLSIRKSAIDESKLLFSLGYADEVDEQIQTKVIGAAKQQAYDMMEKTGVPSSLTEYDMKQYLSTVLKEIRVSQNANEILDIEREILATSNEFNACLKFNTMRLIYNNYFDLYKKTIVKYQNGRHKGIKWITSITDKKSAELARKFVDIGVQIRHVRNMPPIDFAVSDKQMVATIEKVDSKGIRGSIIQNLLVSRESPYIQHFTSIFEELWNQGINAIDRINDVEAGLDFDIEVIQNTLRVQRMYLDSLEAAENEILLILPTTNAVISQDKIGVTRLITKAAKERSIKVRILMPAHELMQYVLQNLSEARQENNASNIDFRFIEQMPGTKATILVVDRKASLVMELKDDSKLVFSEAIGLSTFSNSRPGVQSYVAIFENLWRQTELYQKLTELYEQLKVHDKMQEEFINIAAHELRTPTQAILAFANLIGHHPEKREEMMEAIHRNAVRLQRLTNDILDVTRIESQTLKLKKEQFDLNDLIKDIVQDYRRQLEKDTANAKVLLLYDDDKTNNEDGNHKSHFLIEADRERISQVISNLLGNAIKFTQEGSISINVAKNRDGYVTVAVKDTGVGIDPEILPRLFTKFASKSDIGGTGLGLFISKSIIEAHGGKMWATNNISNGNGEKGATFTFNLPQ